jgi:hypothetical protein
MYPSGCKTGTTYGEYVLIDPTGQVKALGTSDRKSFNYIHNSKFPKGTYTAYVANNWANDAVKDFTFRIYAASDIKISSAAIPKGIDVSQTAVNAKLAEARENPKDFNF